MRVRCCPDRRGRHYEELRPHPGHWQTEEQAEGKEEVHEEEWATENEIWNTVERDYRLNERSTRYRMEESIIVEGKKGIRYLVLPREEAGYSDSSYEASESMK